MGRYLCNPLYITLFLPGVLATFGESSFGSIDSIYMLNRGITPAELGALVGVFYLSVTIAEFPVAILFDRTFSKKIIYTGFFLKITAYLIYAASTNYTGFVLAQIVAGIGVATLSGSVGAFVINHFDDKSYANIGAVTSEWGVVRSLASLIGGGIGLFLFYKLDWAVWFFAAVMTILCTIAFLYVPKLPIPDDIGKFTFRGVFVVLVQLLKKPLFYMVAMQDVVLVGLVMFWQPRFAEIGGGSLYYGFVIVTFAGALASIVFRYYMPRASSVFMLSIVNAALAGAIVISPSGYVFLVLFAIHVVASSILGIIINIAFTESLDDRHRATAGSFVSLVGGMMMMILGPLAGLIAQTWDIATAGWITVAIFLVMALGGIVFFPVSGIAASRKL